MSRSKAVKPVKTIRIDLIGATTDFKGVWTRKDLDVAYRLMLKNLGAHYAKIRAEARTQALEEQVEQQSTENEPPNDTAGETNDLEV